MRARTVEVRHPQQSAEQHTTHPTIVVQLERVSQHLDRLLRPIVTVERTGQRAGTLGTLGAHHLDAATQERQAFLGAIEHLAGVEVLFGTVLIMRRLTGSHAIQLQREVTL